MKDATTFISNSSPLDILFLHSVSFYDHILFCTILLSRSIVLFCSIPLCRDALKSIDTLETASMEIQAFKKLGSNCGVTGTNANELWSEMDP